MEQRDRLKQILESWELYETDDQVYFRRLKDGSLEALIDQILEVSKN
jgi:hypothetical protein